MINISKLVLIFDKIVLYLKMKIFKYEFFKKHNVTIGQGIKLSGIPLVNINSNGVLNIGDNVTLGSSSFGNHFNMHSPLKLMIDKENASIEIGNNSRIFGTCIHAKESIIIGNNCLISANCQIVDSLGHHLSFENVENRINTSGTTSPIVIEDNVWIGSGTIILPGVTIGEGSVIKVNSVVDKNVPAMVLAGGNPIQILENYS